MFGLYWGGLMRSCAAKALCCSIALSAASAAATPPAPHGALPGDPAGRARDAFAEGVRLVEAGDYAAAQSAFTRAYALEPHPLALYNIGQCQARLGQYAAAVQTLERFLDEGGDTIDPAQRRAVTRQIAELRVHVVASGAEVPVPAASSPPASAATVGPMKTEASPPPSASSSVTSSKAPPSWGWILGGTGLALLGSATVLYIWNDGRYDAWKTERLQLEGVPNRELLVQQNAAVWDATHASNERLVSIQRVDLLTAITAGVGAAALGLGIWQLLAGDPASASVPSQASASPFAWRVNW
jgi:tetratricopeptide (TPR) repeat protein